MIKAKWLNVRREPIKKLRNLFNNKEDKIQILECKSKASEEFYGKFITVLGVRF